MRSKRTAIGKNRWHRPRLYLTIVAISLPAFLVLTAFFFSPGHNNNNNSMLVFVNADAKFAGLIPLTAYGWLIILAAPTLASSVALFKGYKIGIFISLATLPLLGFTLGMSIFVFMQGLQSELFTKLLIDLGIALVMVLLGPLLLAWKRIRWHRRANRRILPHRAGASFDRRSEATS
ncbi:MAG TPA: hypothetical protein VJP79_03455 [Nitrososphaera sp.]|nr:hypothetical protein [Nitrososphaera sp.]